MQTFLPYPHFNKSVESLDRARLGKQRIEALQILRTLLGLSDGWKNHPATRMWRGYEYALAIYGLQCCLEWEMRGYKDTTGEKFLELLEKFNLASAEGNPDGVFPPWLGDPDFHRSHRANLVKKDPQHYVPQFGELEWEPYVWPNR